MLNHFLKCPRNIGNQIANTAIPPASDDMLTCLAKAAAAFDRPPSIVTFSGAPVEGLMSHVFGPDATANLITRSRSAAGGADEFVRPDGAAASPLDFEPAIHSVLPRFVDPVAFELTAGHYRGWLARAAGVIVHFPPSRKQIGILSEVGFGEARTFADQGRRETVVFMRPPETLPPPRAEPTAIDRPAMRRLVIVDPCLGGAGGHYLPFARSLTQAARALGVAVIWGCHRRLDDDAAPGGVQVRRCFPRCFFDLSMDEPAKVDLSPELLEGWVELLDEFVGAGTHFLAHNADAHLLRAAAGLLEARPRRSSVVHLGFHTSPRRMPGRAQGDEAHRVVMRVRRAPEWERSLFFWTENQRLGRWMSQWLQSPVPTLPLLAPSGPGAGVRERKARGSLTVSVLGESRPSKGFLELPEIIDRIAAAPLLAGAVKVVIQNWRPASGYTEKHEQTVARLRRHSFVEILEGVLEVEDYLGRLEEADVLLLPYNPEIYNLRGSGILIEGLSRGAVILARAGTAMEDAATEGVVFAYETPEDVVQVLIGLLSALTETLDRARRMAVHFREVNTPEQFVGALDARARGEP